MHPERKRLLEAKKKKKKWHKWGPYLAERQWGTVREDYSPGGDAWTYFPFDHAALRAYRWGEDGIGGISDWHQILCFSFAFWNEQDPCLKERIFGLTNDQANHGEDVKECYYYLDNTPTHSYMKMLYKYPQKAFPYADLLHENKRRGPKDYEYELVDTGIFNEDRYFDLFLEYAKGGPEDLLIRATAYNRGPDEAPLHLLGQLWFRNTWSWKNLDRPGEIRKEDEAVVVIHPELGKRYLYFDPSAALLFTENETNLEALYLVPNASPYVKDAFQRAIVQKASNATNPDKKGTKAALHHSCTIPSGQAVTFCFRLSDQKLRRPFSDFEKIFKKRQKEADQFYTNLAPSDLCSDQRSIQRQAFAGLLWSKQFYNYIVEEWLEGDNPMAPPPASRKQGRNAHWKHLYSQDILSMPDTWEFPWFASWDLAFHCLPLSLLDPEEAKRQLLLLMREWYMHPNGQVPAYEWNFEDVNPPVIAWGAWRVFKIAQRKHGEEDRPFLEQMFQKLIMNFTWWVNRKDVQGKNVFEGGFLGLDNISVFNRSEQLPREAELTQCDGTSWMAMFCLNMWTIAMELAEQESAYQDMAAKFFKHFLYIADAINFQHPESPPLWDEEDGFYYDLLKRKDGTYESLKIRSMVGLIPLFAVATLEEEKLEQFPEFKKRFEWFLKHRSDLCIKVSCLHTKGINNRRLLSLLDRDKLIRILQTMLDENEFLSPYGLRSLSKVHQEHPFRMQCGDTLKSIDYEPAESTTGLFGGNSNWRGPVWFPLNYLVIESLQKYHHYYGDTLKVECPTGSGNYMNLWDVSKELSDRLIKIFEKGSDGKRPVFGGTHKYQTDPNFCDYPFFHEYFHGDEGAGLGASHQTGWTALVAKLIQQCETRPK